MLRPACRLITCLLGSIAAIAVPFVGSAVAATHAPLTEAQAQQIDTDAYVYGIAPLEFLRQQQTNTSVTVPNDLADAPTNQLASDRTLATASNEAFVAPNLDTLYTFGHVNLTKGPLVLRVPKVSGGRYYSFEFLDPYTNVFRYVGTRTTGNGSGNFAIVGPKFQRKLPGGLRRITAPYADVWLVGRTQVYGAQTSDLPAVHKIQNGYKLIPLTAFEKVGMRYTTPKPSRILTTPTVATIPTGLAFLDELGNILAQSPPPARDHVILAELKTAGIGPGLNPSTENLPAAEITGLENGVAAGPAKVRNDRIGLALASLPKHHGWYVSPFNIGHFGTDYALRAVISVYGIAANIPAEAMYPTGTLDSAGQQLIGANHYVIRFATGQLPPARYFWSLTVYNATTNLVANSINRYSLGSTSNALRHNADGSLDIYLQSTPPAGHQSNWIPTPASGPWRVIMRMYGPKAAALNDTYQYPAITNLG
jgi:hypothetical protein